MYLVGVRADMVAGSWVVLSTVENKLGRKGSMKASVKRAMRMENCPQ